MKKILILGLVAITLLLGACTKLSAHLVSYKDEMDVSEPIIVKFNKRMAPRSLNEKNVRLLYADRHKKMNGHVIYTKNLKRLQFMPSRSLLTSTEYELVISPRAKYANGKDIGKEISFKFRTRPAHKWEKTGAPKRKEIYLIKNSDSDTAEVVTTEGAISTSGAIEIE